jgi:hypothetical protein
MKYSASLLSAMAVVGQAYDATLTSKDSFGKILSQDMVTFEAGQDISAMINLGVSSDTLASIEFSTDTYAANMCKFSMSLDNQDKKFARGKKHMIGMFDEVCHWPQVQVLETGKKVSSFTGTIDVREMDQFKREATLYVDCATDDVTLFSQASDITCSTTTPTIEGASLRSNEFDFRKVFITKKFLLRQTIYVHFSQFMSIFFAGGNPVIDAIFDGENLYSYQMTKDAIFQYSGFPQSTLSFPNRLQSSGKGGNKYGTKPVTKAQYEKMRSGIEIVGYTTYWSQLLIDLTSIYNNWDSLLTWDMESWAFYQVVTGGVAFNSNYYMEKNFYFQAYYAMMETISMVMIILSYKDMPYWLPVWFPRTLNAYWKLSMSLLTIGN